MSRTIAQIECKKCGDVFEATSDDYASCKCGLSAVKPDGFSASYKTDNGRGMNFKIVSNKTHYFESDFYIMKGEVLDSFNNIRKMCDELDFHLYDDYEYGENGEKYLSYISYTKSETSNKYTNEDNIIEFTIRFKHMDDESFIKRLNGFKDFLTSLKNDTIKISDRKELKDKYEYDKSNLGHYDYTFYF